MALKDDLYDVFVAMKDPSSLDTDGDSYLAREIGKIIKQFVADRTLTVVPSPVVGADTTPTGSFSGNATVSWQITGSKIEDKIKAAETSDMTDDDFAQAFGDALDADAPQWTASLSGNTVTTSSPPQTVPSSDSGTITATYQSAPVVTALKAAFKQMKQMIHEGEDGDDVFATTLATAITTYYTTAVVQGMGATHLSGVQFSLVIS